MGEHEGWLQSGGLLPNGLLTDEVGNVCRVLDGERWLKAEERTAELIDCIQPNRPSEERRNAVANYVQRLIMKCFSCEVFTFGSVPLKTYLPDGDIDLTAFSKDENLKDTWANEVREVLENEERDANAEFRVKEVQYIQAEVKIIKCLVENIVVDISFNQVGGLCTLCFLEEIDHLINQNHLFKRSILLIKAWCYYESRILGAHHGLISTYALETLVLYIFHVFNNSFAGPLEVLYRFLEFFSNFDWENFCVSLWGPVPISSLPDMTAEPPRRDGGELLLGKLFLQACSEVYAVLPGGQENPGQQFVSKHFNVIDPLRTNNNLGRSVSKGNFYRIRSAFSFGAKKLTNLLDCSKENLIAEVNMFFMNTLERHGSGKRPDAPASSIPYSLLSNGPVELNNSINTLSLKKKSGSSGVQVTYEHQGEGECACHGHASHFLNTITQPSQHAYRTSKSSTVSHTLSPKGRANQINSRETDHMERIAKSSVSIQPDKNQKNSRPDFSVSDQEGHTRFQFARTQSSPELARTFTDALTRMRHNRVFEAGKTRNEHSRSDYGSRRKTMASEVPNVQNTRFPFDDPLTLKQSSSHQSLDVATVSYNVSNVCPDDSVFTAMGEELASVFEALELRQQAEQDLINMMASPRNNNFDGQFQLPTQVASHLSFPLPPIVASMGYAERNMAGIVPTNIALIDPSWVSGMQLRQGFVPSMLPHYFPNTMVNLNSEEAESATDNSGVAEMSSEDGDPWHDHDIRVTGGFEIVNGGSQMLHSDERKHSSASGYNYLPSSRGNISGTPVARGNHKIAAENRDPRDDYPVVFQHQIRKANEITSSGRNANLRFVPMTQGSSSGIKPFSETSRDVLSSKVSKSRDKWGRRPSVSAVATSLHGEASSRWQFESASEHVSSQEDDGSGDWVPISTAVAKKADRTLGSATSASSRGADSVIPVAPMLVGGSRQRVGDNSGVFPFAFYPTGPPVPFLTMLPVYNFPADGTNSDSLINQINEDRGENHACPSENNFDSTESFNQSEGHTNHMNLGTSNGEASKPSEELKLDILNSDFASHWQNLQYGRLCQNTPNHEPLVYPPPLMVPPVYLQGHFPLDGPGRPPTSNVNVFTHSMGYDPWLAPITSLQPGPSRPSSVVHRYGEEPRRYHGGTGTYLPNPKAPYRDRHFSSTRNHRGSYKHDRGDHNDREGSWINSKARSTGRSHGRNHNDKLSLRPDRPAASDGRPEGVWDSYRHDQVAPLQAQNSSFGSSISSLRLANVAYGMHPLPGVSSNGVGLSGSGAPSVVMLYPYEQGVGYGSFAESLEFGTLGPVHLSNNEAARPGDGNPSRRFYDQRHAAIYRGGPSRSSPDQPSSPQNVR